MGGPRPSPGLVILGLSVRVTTGEPSGQASADASHSCRGVTFYHPVHWIAAPVRAHDVGSAPLCHTALFIGPSDAIDVSAYRMPRPVSAANLATVTPVVTSALRRAAAEGGGRLSAGPQRTTVGGLPALRFRFTNHSYYGTPVTSTIVIVFDGSAQYEINCQQSRAHAAQVTWACGQVLRTFTVAGRPGGPASPAPGTAPATKPSTTPAHAESPQRWLQGLGSLKRQMNFALAPGVITAGSLRRTAATLRRCTSELAGLGPPPKVLRPTYRLASRACAAFAQAAGYAAAAARAYYTSGAAGRTETKLLNRTDAAVNHGIRLIADAFYGAPVYPPG